MSKKLSVCMSTWLAGLAFVLVMLLGRQTIQAQNPSVLPSFTGETDLGTAYAVLTYSGDRPYGIIAVSNSEKPCQPHFASPGRRNPSRPRQPRKANPNPGKQNPGIPCAQQPITKSRRHLGRGRRV